MLGVAERGCRAAAGAVPNVHDPVTVDDREIPQAEVHVIPQLLT